MPNRCPQLIDYLRYTEARKIVEGDVLLSEFSRLTDLVAEKSDLNQLFKFKFEFGIDDFSNRFIKGQIKGQVKLTCQRCMNAMSQSINLDLALAFITKKEQEQTIAGLYDSFYIENKDPIDFLALMEDEIILSLPIIAKHQDENCLSSILTDEDKQLDEIDIAYIEEQEKKINPFAVLEQLKN